jgi:hypothetical protein
VKQGCTLAPILFSAYIQAVVEVLDARMKQAGLTHRPFLTKPDFVLRGRKHNLRDQNTTAFFMDRLFYADDGEFHFETRDDLQKGCEIIFDVMKCFGLSCHVGRNGKASKTEAMYFPRPRQRYEDADTSDLHIDGGTIPFVKKFKYLGSIISNDLKDDLEIDARIKAAGGAFASAAKQFFTSKQIPLKHKKVAYEGLILSILLFGSECWTLSAETRRRLNSFHNRCIRQMCRLTTWHQWKLHIHQHTMESRLDVKCLDFYLAKRRLSWAGHLARMDFDERLPRKLLSGWIDSKRPRGRPQNGFAHALMTDISNAGLDASNWFTLAAQKGRWDEFIRQEDIHNRPSAAPPTQVATQDLRRSSRIAAQRASSRPRPPSSRHP